MINVVLYVKLVRFRYLNCLKMLFYGRWLYFFVFFVDKFFLLVCIVKCDKFCSCFKIIIFLYYIVKFYGMVVF